jgi:hypothetical protein
VRGHPGARECAASTSVRFVCSRGPWATIDVERSSGRGRAVETIVERPAALDLHKARVTACARVPAGRGRRERHVAEFATTVRGRLDLRDWLAGHGVTQVVMEATDVYRRPRPRRGHKRALGAVKHSMICAIWKCSPPARLTAISATTSPTATPTANQTPRRPARTPRTPRHPPGGRGSLSELSCQAGAGAWPRTGRASDLDDLRALRSSTRRLLLRA